MFIFLHNVENGLASIVRFARFSPIFQKQLAEIRVIILDSVEKGSPTGSTIGQINISRSKDQGLYSFLVSILSAIVQSRETLGIESV